MANTKFDTLKFKIQIRDLRVMQKEIDLRAAAREIGISHSTLSKAEKMQTCDLNTILLICDWMGKSISEFLIVKK